MKPNKASQLWAAHCCGEQLTDAEADHLADAVACDEVLQADLLEDRGLHRTLKALAAIDESRDDFVSGVLRDVDNPQTIPTPSRGRSRRSFMNGVKHSWLITGVVTALIGVALPTMFILGTIFVSRDSATTNQIVELRLENERLRQKLDELHRIVTQPEQRISAGDEQTDGSPSESIAMDAKRDRSRSPSAPLSDAAPLLREWVVVDSGDANWKEVPGTAKPGQFALLDGVAELQTPGGSRIRLSGPATGELTSGQHVYLSEGMLAALVAPDDIGFRVTTPNARVVDLGTEFEVRVTDDGATSVDLQGGEVVVIPWQDGQSGERLHLAEGGFHTATISPAGDATRQLLSSSADGPKQFRGQLSLGGKSMTFTQQERFDEVRERVLAEMERSGSSALKNWLSLNEAFETVTGSVTMDGETASLDSLEGLMDFEESLVEGGQPDREFGNNVEVFAGTVVINGQRRTFSNREEYEQFRREMLQSLDQLGILSPRRRQREIDEKTNPFLPGK